MCGIAGLLDLDTRRNRPDALRQMADALRHRGPDGEGTWSGGPIHLAHRRLAIIDLETGQQPMVSPCGRFAISYNGELYNYRELRKELEPHHHFTTRSDTEVVLASYMRWGAEAFARFNGIFALAVADMREKKLILACDPAGVKPLYCRRADGAFWFASEVRALFAASGSAAPINKRALAALLQWRYVPSPLTLFDGVEKLCPGTVLMVDASGAATSQRYTPPAPCIEDVTEDEALHRLSRLAGEAVTRQLLSDVPVGILLSGGVDSALLASIAHEHSTSALTAFTVGFAGSAADEREEAAATAQWLGMPHVTMEVDEASFFSALPDAVCHMESPFATTSAVPLFLLARTIGESRKVVLSGQGADELWGGYRRHYADLSGVGFGYLARMAAPLFPSRTDAGKALAALGEPDTIKRYTAARMLLSDDERSRLMRAARDEGYTAHLLPFEAEMPGREPLNRALLLDRRTQLADDLLLYTDKTSMAHGVEVRVPFLDIELIAFAESVPAAMKIRGFNRKWLWKQFAGRTLPAHVVQREKKGFDTPVSEWLRGKRGGEVTAALTANDARIAAWLDQEEIVRLAEDHRSGRADRSKELFLLYTLELWAAHFNVR